MELFGNPVQEAGRQDVKLYVRAQIHISLICGECECDLRTADLEASETISLSIDSVSNHVRRNTKTKEYGLRRGCSLIVSQTYIEETERASRAGGTRRTYYGAKIRYHVTCRCSPDQLLHAGTFVKDIDESSMNDES
ncbi:MAG: hypothetical protein NT062_11265 [Proteobacteria bacterium]|nr:hypothetical protein [Pseudomonadota bacterium]